MGRELGAAGGGRRRSRGARQDAPTAAASGRSRGAGPLPGTWCSAGVGGTAWGRGPRAVGRKHRSLSLSSLQMPEAGQRHRRGRGLPPAAVWPGSSSLETCQGLGGAGPAGLPTQYSCKGSLLLSRCFGATVISTRVGNVTCGSAGLGACPEWLSTCSGSACMSGTLKN